MQTARHGFISILEAIIRLLAYLHRRTLKKPMVTWYGQLACKLWSRKSKSPMSAIDSSDASWKKLSKPVEKIEIGVNVRKLGRFWWRQWKHEAWKCNMMQECGTCLAISGWCGLFYGFYLGFGQRQQYFKLAQSSMDGPEISCKISHNMWIDYG